MDNNLSFDDDDTIVESSSQDSSKSESSSLDPSAESTLSSEPEDSLSDASSVKSEVSTQTSSSYSDLNRKKKTTPGLTSLRLMNISESSSYISPLFNNNLFSEKTPTAPPYKWSGTLTLEVNITLQVHDGRGLITVAWVYANLGHMICHNVDHSSLLSYWSVIVSNVIKSGENKWLFRGKVRWDVSGYCGDLSFNIPLNVMKTLRNQNSLHTVSVRGSVRTVPGTSEGAIGGISRSVQVLDNEMRRSVRMNIKENYGLYVSFKEDNRPIDFLDCWHDFFQRSKRGKSSAIKGKPRKSRSSR
ncbi:MAG: putative matrix protein [Wufeng shrew rhabdovirus 9]|nr:MAG: putative matrix protein [Wufeng shrew rhabdovirus 9]